MTAREAIEAPGPDAAAGEVLPVSFGQQRIWFMHHLAPDRPVYNLPTRLRLRGPLEPPALRAALDAIVQRHEALRTAFIATGEGLRQLVLPSAPSLNLPSFDLRRLPEPARRAEMVRLEAENARRPFDLGRPPLLRAALLRLGVDEHLLLLTLHHIVFDAWSLGVFLRELGALYGALVCGAPAALPEPPVQYGDFTLWQRQAMDSEAMRLQLDYWQRRLRGVNAVIDLPTDRPRPAVQSFSGARQPLFVDPGLTESLRRLAKGANATLFMTLVAAVSTLLLRHTGSTDLVIGAAFAGRTQAELEGLIGFLVNTLPLRIDLSSDPSFLLLLQRVRATCLEAVNHQDLPFERLVSALRLERDLSRDPLQQVLFAFQNVPPPPTALAGLELAVEEGETGTAKTDLTIFLEGARRNGADVLQGSIEYNTDLFDAETISRMIARLHTILEAIGADSGRRLSELPILPPAEEKVLVLEWNRTNRPYPERSTIPAIFEALVRQAPQAPALIGQGESLTYRELNLRANRLAHYLVQRGVGAEVPVGVCLDRSVETVISILAILKAGGAYLPLDPRYPPARLGFILSDTRAPLVLTQRELPPGLPDSARTLSLDSAREEIAAQPAEDPVGGAGAMSLAYVMYTSGSTGTPKGVGVPHRAILRLVRDTDYTHLGPGDTLLQFAPLGFDASTFEIWGALLNGARLVVFPSHSPDLAELGEAVRAHGVTVLWLTAGLFHQMVEEQPEALRGLRQLLAGGDVLSPVHVGRALRLLPPGAMTNGYGPTEGTTFTCCFRVDDPARITTTVPIGRPIANTQVYLLDRFQRLVPIGVTGELYVGGSGLARGYLNRPELTAERFLPSPFGRPGERLYRTGDLARFRGDGNLEFQGRTDHQVKIRGFRIELGEIEATLARHPGVLQAAVLSHSRAGRRQLVAYAVLRSGVSTEEVRRFLKEQLPDYALPALLVPLEALPLTENGKVDRNALAAADPGPARPQGSTQARNETERVLARVWSRVLGLDGVGVDDSFFDLGGDSILAMQMVSQARQAGLALTTRDLFRHQTIAELAAAAGSAPPPQPQPTAQERQIPLLPMQHRFLEQAFPDPDHWNGAVRLVAGRTIDPALLEAAAQSVLDRHGALRLRFTRRESAWEQRCAPAGAPVAFTHLDLGGEGSKTRRPALETALAQLHRSLDLARGPIFRMALVTVPGALSEVLVLAHHLAFDGVSARIVIEDLQTAYDQLSRGDPVRLPDPTTPVQEWARRLDQHARSSELRRELPYWTSRERLEAPALPQDFPGGANSEATVEQVEVELDQDQTAVLLQAAPRAAGAQIGELLLAALAHALAEWTGRPANLFYLVAHGRDPLFEELDVSRTVGYLIHLVPILLAAPVSRGLEGAASVARQLRQVPGQGLGHGLLRYCGGDPAVAAALRAMPQPQLIFNYQGQLDPVDSSSALFRLSMEPEGPSRAARLARALIQLHVVARVTAGRFRVGWAYSREVHHRATVEWLAASFLDRLRQFSQEATSRLPRGAGSGGK